jgi:hypothetical protein
VTKIRLYCFLFSAAAVAFASAQSAPRRLRMEQLEKEQDPPMFIFRTDVSPGKISQLGNFTSVQVNVNAKGQNIVGDAANEPSITLDPSAPTRMSIGWRQFNSSSSNFRQGGFAYTSNGGASWTFPGVLDSVFRSDPVLFSDETGTFFYLSLVANFRDDIWRSLNGGQLWTRLAPATGGDKQWFTIDRTNSPGHGFQYQFWDTGASDYGSRQFTRSTDGGFTWLDPIDIPNAPEIGTLDVDTSGNLFLGGFNPNFLQFWCVRSSDAKNSALTPTFDQTTAVDMGGILNVQPPINPVGLVGQLFLAVDRSGTTTNNNIYMVASVTPDDGFHASDVMFAKSTDGGLTFSPPRRINDDAANAQKWHWFGTVAVAPNGRIDVVWLDTRNAANNTDSQLFYSYSTDGGDTWSANVAVSNPFNPFLGYPDQQKMGDYITIVSDNFGGNVAYTATFNGEEDIYYVRVAPPGTPPLPTPTPSPTPTATATATASPKPTATATSTPTATATATSTPTATATSTPIATATASPTATATVTASATSTPTATARPTATATATPAQALNLSTRMRVDLGDNVGIGGFIIKGSTPKHVLIRAIGPSLTALGVPDALADPFLELYASGPAPIASNNNWKDSQEGAIRATGVPPNNDLESAIDTTLTPGSYTAIVKANNGGNGVALVEVYDLNAWASHLVNLSTRAFVGTGGAITIAGFILGRNDGPGHVIIRGIGPSLSSAGISNALGNPDLELRDSNGALLLANKDWQDDPAQAAQIMAAGLAPHDHLESAIAATLPPGQYTALLAGENDATGIGLVEIYVLDP